MATLAELELATDPIAQPLTYPGRPADGSVVLVGDEVVPVRTHDGPGELEALLARHGVAPLAARRVVLAVGSNAAPAQVRRKFGAAGASTVVPLLRCRVDGLDVGHSAHVSRPGYVPATPVGRVGATSGAVLLHVDDGQLPALDVTEPNYVRVPVADVLGPGGTVRLDDTVLDDVEVYTSRHALVGPPGDPWPFRDQRTTVARLLDHLPEVRARSGADPAAAVQAWARSAALRDLVRRSLRGAGLVGPAQVG